MTCWALGTSPGEYRLNPPPPHPPAVGLRVVRPVRVERLRAPLPPAALRPGLTELEIEDVLSEKILFGEIREGDFVAVDVDGEGDDAKFTFTGDTQPRVPDALPAAN